MDTFLLKAILKMAKFKDLGGLTLPESLTEFESNLAKYAISEGTKTVINEATGGSSIIEVCSGRWPDIDVSNFLYSEAEIPLGTSFELVDHSFFETREIGKSEIRVGTKSGQNVFGGAPPALKQKQIEVIGIEVQVTPSDVVMEPSEIQTFDAAVLHASDDRVEWTLPAGFSEIGQENFGKTIIIQAPPAEANWNTPVSLRARSQANTGSRNGEVDSDPRDGFALIRPRTVGSWSRRTAFVSTPVSRAHSPRR